MAEGSKTEGGGEQANTRWWESYLVRYFLGFIVGVLCLSVLAADSGLLDKVALFADKDGKRDWTLVAICGALFGLGYCYIASTPITVLHYGRYGFGFVESSSRNFWLGWVLLLVLYFFGLFPRWWFSPALGVVLTAAAVMLIRFLPPRGDSSIQRATNTTTSRGENTSSTSSNSAAEVAEQRTPNEGVDSAGKKPSTQQKPIDSAKNTNEQSISSRIRTWFQYRPRLLILVQAVLWLFVMASCSVLYWSFCAPNEPRLVRGLWLYSLPVIWIGVAQYAVLARVLTSEHDAHEFVKNLAKARQRKGAREIRDTYTHLREHSNSIFIVVVELSMLAALLALHKSGESRGVATSEFFTNVLMLIGIWMVPTIFMWSRANQLEAAFSKDPKAFCVVSEKEETNPVTVHVKIID